MTDPSRREPTGRVMTADLRSACGRNPRSEARSDATAPGPMLTSPWTRFWAVCDPAARGPGARSPQENRTARSGPPWGRAVAAPAFAERGRSRIPRYPRHIGSSRVSNRAHRPQKPPIPALCRFTQERPARSGPAVKARLGLARLGGHDPETPPESTTRVGSTARRARSGSTGPVRRAHEAWHRGYRWDLFRWDWSGSASPMP